MFENNGNSLGKVKPTIFFVWNYLEWGGGQIYLLAIMKAAKPDWNIKVVLPTGSSEQIRRFIEAIGVEYEMIDAHLDLQPAPTLGRKLERHYRKIRCEYRTLRYLSKQTYDVLHIDMMPWQSLGALVYLLSRSSVFVTMHNRLPVVARWRYWYWQYKFAILTKFRRFHIFASNEDTKKSLRGLVPEKFRQSVKVTYTAIDEFEIARIKENQIDRIELLRQYNLPTDKFLVFCVGQFIDRKGRWTFLEAAQKIQETNSNVFFVWITNSTLNDQEREQIRGYQLTNFSLLEANKFVRDREQLLTLISAADLFVLPSFVEGLPIALLEAMALGVPSISTRVNAIPEAIIHLKTGWLVEPGESLELVKAILTLKESQALREKLSRNGCQRVLELFTERVSAQTALASYRTSLENCNLIS